MSACLTDMRDFIVVLEQQVPRPLHPCADEAIGCLLTELRDSWEDPLTVLRLSRRICRRVGSELQFEADNAVAAGDFRAAWRLRAQASRFAARWGSA